MATATWHYDIGWDDLVCFASEDQDHGVKITPADMGHPFYLPLEEDRFVSSDNEAEYRMSAARKALCLLDEGLINSHVVRGP